MQLDIMWWSLFYFYEVQRLQNVFTVLERFHVLCFEHCITVHVIRQFWHWSNRKRPWYQSVTQIFINPLQISICYRHPWQQLLPVAYVIQSKVALVFYFAFSYWKYISCQVTVHLQTAIGFLVSFICIFCVHCNLYLRSCCRWAYPQHDATTTTRLHSGYHAFLVCLTKNLIFFSSDHRTSFYFIVDSSILLLSSYSECLWTAFSLENSYLMHCSDIEWSVVLMLFAAGWYSNI